jgi:hypothetical protein
MNVEDLAVAAWRLIEQLALEPTAGLRDNQVALRDMHRRLTDILEAI